MSRRRFRRFCVFPSLVVVLFAMLLGNQTTLAQDDDDPLAIRDFNTAADWQNSGLYARAGKRWEEFIAEYKNDKRLDRALYNLGVCQLHTKQYDDAIKTFTQVAEKYQQLKQLAALRYNLGMAHYLKAGESQQEADYTAAAKAFGEAAEKHAESKYADRALYFQGEAFYSAGNDEASRQAFATLLSKYPQSPLLADASYALGTAQQEAGLMEDAAETYSAFLANDKLKQHEFATEVRLRLAMTLFAQDKYAEAQQHFEQVAAEEEFPNADFALLRQAQCHYQQDQLDEAARLNQSLVKKFPESQYVPSARLAAGKCFYQQQKWNEARSQLDSLAKSEGSAQQEAAYWLGRTLLQQEKPKEALSLLEKIANKIPADHEFAPHVKLARLDALYALPDRREETAAGYAEFAKQFPQHQLAAQAQYMAAHAALGQENFEAARKYAETFLDTDQWQQSEFMPSVLFVAGEAHLLGAQQELEGAELDEAEKYYRQLVKEYPSNDRIARSHLRLGWLMHHNGKFNEAADYLNGIVGKLSTEVHKAEAYLLIGQSRLDNQQAAEAIGPLKQSIDAKDDWEQTDEALILLAQAYRLEEQPKEAAQQLSRLENEYKQSEYRGQALYLLGAIAQEQANREEAAKRYQAVLNEYVDDPFAALAAYGLGAVQLTEGKYEDAERAFTQLLDKYDDAETHTLARYWRGVARHRLEKFEPARADLQQFVEEANESEQQAAMAKVPSAMLTLARCQLEQEQFGSAAATLTSLLKEHPQYAERDKAYYELGHAHLSEQKAAEAADAFRSLTESSPESPLAAEAYFFLGTLSEKQADQASEDEAKSRQYAAAQAAFSAGLKTASDDTLREKLQYKLGNMQFQQEQFAEAASTLDTQLKEFPQGELAGPARYLAAESYFRQDQFDQALPYFEQVAAEKVEPYTAQAYYRAGAAAAALKNWSSSEKAYRTLVDQYDDFPLAAEAKYGLATALKNQNQHDEAVKLYEQIAANSTSKTAAKSRFMVGEIAFGKKEYDRAIEHFLEVAAGYPYPQWQGLARLEAGRCFMQLKKPEQAKKQFEIIAQRFADHERAADAARLLAELNK